jgi:lysophospholipase L1-like esterase
MCNGVLPRFLFRSVPRCIVLLCATAALPLVAADEAAKLPRVLIVGDSVSMGYTGPTQKLLAGKADVQRAQVNGAPTNCGPTKNGLTSLQKWLGDGRWDVIHFNFGLHDAKLPPEGVGHAPLDVYEKNLRTLVTQMRATGAKLIWATTTPVPDGGILSPTRRFGSIDAYNAVAKKVMDENGVAIDDLNGAIAPHVAKLQIPHDVHFSAAGSQLLAEHVAAAIERALAK